MVLDRSGPAPAQRGNSWVQSTKCGIQRIRRLSDGLETADAAKFAVAIRAGSSYRPGRQLAESGGYRPATAISTRSSSRSRSLNPRIRHVASADGVRATIRHVIRSRSNWSAQSSILGLKNRTNVVVPGTNEPTSLPLRRLHDRHAYARLSADVRPPCFSLIMWSTSHPKNVSSS
jgi:hypothetical protein